MELTTSDAPRIFFHIPNEADNSLTKQEAQFDFENVF